MQLETFFTSHSSPRFSVEKVLSKMTFTQISGKFHTLLIIMLANKTQICVKYFPKTRRKLILGKVSK